MALAAGAHLGHYVVVASLGAGGMGEVYRARDERLGRDVAIKILPDSVRSDPDALARFAREAKAVAALSHRNIISIHHFETAGDTPFFVMELLDGETLASRLTRGPLPWKEAVDIATHVADALAAAHQRRVIHRDLKPANIFVTSDGTVKVLDFGLARAERAGEAHDGTVEMKTATGVVLGTPAYMSPEQISGEPIDGRSDVFSFGCVLYELLTGHSPFARSTVSATLAAVLLGDPAPIAVDGPPAVSRIVEKCLRKNREERYQSAEDVARDLRMMATPEADVPIKARSHRWRRGYAIGASLSVLVVVVSIIEFRGHLKREASSISADVHTLAVLPFENVSKDSASEFLSDGITEGLIDALTKLPHTRVAARTSVFAYKGKRLKLDQVARELGVRTVLTGRVIARGASVTVQADLIDAQTGAELWGERYNQASTNPVVVEQEIIARVAAGLRISLSGDQQARLATRPTDNPDAYRLYLRARHEWNKRTRAELISARQYFQQAIDLDPTFALAFVGLADTYGLMGARERILPQSEAWAKASAAANRALEIDPTNAEAHASLGYVESMQFHWKAAERELRTAIDLNPNYSSAHNYYAGVLRSLGRFDEALAQHRSALEADPLSPPLYVNFAATLIETGDLDGAISAANKALDLNPKFFYSYIIIGNVHDGRHEYRLAGDAYRQVGRLGGPPHTTQAALARIAAEQGDTAEARRVARELEAAWPGGDISPTHIAWIYAALKENDRALSWLEKALETRDPVLHDSNSVRLEELRTDPRYVTLIRRLRSL